MTSIFTSTVVEDIDGVSIKTDAVSIPHTHPTMPTKLVEIRVSCQGVAYLDPATARALAAALTEAADEAELRQLEEDAIAAEGIPGNRS